MTFDFTARTAVVTGQNFVGDGGMTKKMSDGEDDGRLERTKRCGI